MTELHRSIDLRAFDEEIRSRPERYKYRRLTYRTNELGETDVEIEPITEGVLIRTSAHAVEVGTPVTVTVETPEDRSDALVNIKLNKDIVDLVQIQFPGAANKYGWREAALTWTPERPGVYEISADGGGSTIVRAYRRGGVQ